MIAAEYEPLNYDLADIMKLVTEIHGPKKEYSFAGLDNHEVVAMKNFDFALCQSICMSCCYFEEKSIEYMLRQSPGLKEFEFTEGTRRESKIQENIFSLFKKIFKVMLECNKNLQDIKINFEHERNRCKYEN